MTNIDKKAKTPDSASGREKTASDDEAVSSAVNIDPATAGEGATSVLPGPPIPPAVQNRLRNEQQTGKTTTSGRRGPSSPKRAKESVK